MSFIYPAGLNFQSSITNITGHRETIDGQETGFIANTEGLSTNDLEILFNVLGERRIVFSTNVSDAIKLGEGIELTITQNFPINLQLEELENIELTIEKTQNVDVDHIVYDKNSPIGVVSFIRTDDWATGEPENEEIVIPFESVE